MTQSERLLATQTVDMPGLLTRKEACEYLNCSYDYLRVLIRKRYLCVVENKITKGSLLKLAAKTEG